MNTVFALLRDDLWLQRVTLLQSQDVWLNVAFLVSVRQTVRYVQEVAESVVLKEDSGRRR